MWKLIISSPQTEAAIKLLHYFDIKSIIRYYIIGEMFFYMEVERMEGLTKEQMMRLFTLVKEANESLKKAQKLLPKDSFISKSIADNERFLSFRKLFEENPDSEIPEGLKVVFIKKDMKEKVMRNDWTTANIEKLKREPLDYIQ